MNPEIICRQLPSTKAETAQAESIWVCIRSLTENNSPDESDTCTQSGLVILLFFGYLHLE